MRWVTLILCLLAFSAKAERPNDCTPGDRYTFQKEMDGEMVTFYALCIWDTEESRYTWYISNMNPDYPGHESTLEIHALSLEN